MTAVEVRGPLDEEALRKAIQLAAKGYPQFRSRIKETKKGRKYYLVWDHDPDMAVPMKTMDIPGCGLPRADPGRLLHRMRLPSTENGIFSRKDPLSSTCSGWRRTTTFFPPVIHHVQRTLAQHLNSAERFSPTTTSSHRATTKLGL